ncbi:autism susceptibility 2 protein-like isoform X1 [Biomphalaria glabrata]
MVFLPQASTHSGSGQGYVCDVESGDDKASESGSDLYSGIPSTAIVNHLPTNGHSNPCVALTAPTPPPSTSTTPTSLCNGVGGSSNHSPSPVHHQTLVSSTSTTSTTSTSSTSRPGLSVDALTSTSSSVTVIQSTSPYGCQFSPAKNKRPLSPSSQLVIDTSTCARSLQYSKSLKANHTPSHSNKAVPHLLTSSNLQHIQQQPVDSFYQNGPNNIVQPTPSPKSYPNSHFPYPSPVPAGYPALVRPDPLAVVTSPRTEPPCTNVSQSASLITGPSISPASSQPHLITAAHHPHSVRPQHYISPNYSHKPGCPTPPSTWNPAAAIDSGVKSSQPQTPKGLIETLSAGSSRDTIDRDKLRYKDVGSHSSHSHQSKERERETLRAPISVNSSLSSPSFPAPKPVWSSSPGQLYNPLLHHHSSPLHPPSVPPQTSPIFPALPLAHPPPLLAAGNPSLPSAMFAPPIPPAPPSLAAAPLTTHPVASSQFSADSLIRSQDFLHQDLNNRLLAHRDSGSLALPPAPFVRSSETHQHQHQHQHLHNHMHQHTYSGLSASPLVPPAPPLFDKIPKVFESGVFRPSIVPSYSAAFSSLLPPGPSGASLASSLQGAFQPKSLMEPGQMLVNYRDREKVGGVPPTHKKQGKWCAVHVRVAWEIYHRQQKQSSEPLSGASSKLGKDTKPLEPTHLLPSTRPPDLGPPTPGSLLASVARSVPDGIVHPTSSFLSSSNLVSAMPSFPRPSPYGPQSLLNPLGFSGLGSSMFAPVRDIVPTSQAEWGRLHRTPSSFPSWPKTDMEREKERERELRKEEEKERERRSSTSSHRLPDESRHKELDRPKSRSRSRSPLRNGHGRLDHLVKPESSHYDRRPHSASMLSTSAMKLKEERREEELVSHHIAEREKLERERAERERMERERLERDRLERDRLERDRLERERMEKEKLLQSEREKMIQAVEQRDKYFQNPGYIGLTHFAPGLPPHPGLLDRRVGLMGPPGVSYPFLDRAPVPTTMWSPFDKSVEMQRVEFERERERMAMMSRLASNIPSQLAALEHQERIKEQFIREQQEREYELRRQYLERLPAFSADRLRAADPLTLGGFFPRTLSPMFGPGALAGLKSNSPHIPGVPPALIPSSSSTAATLLSSRSHDNSPSSSSKSKGCSPADSTSDLKDKREGGSSTDPDAHSR